MNRRIRVNGGRAVDPPPPLPLPSRTSCYLTGHRWTAPDRVPVPHNKITVLLRRPAAGLASPDTCCPAGVGRVPNPVGGRADPSPAALRFVPGDAELARKLG